MSKPPVTFYFDYISPYAYLAWKAIRGLCERNGRSVEAVPILFAALLNAHGQKGPAEIPPKRLYTFKHVFRQAALLGLPLMPPPSHPFNPLTALRASSLLDEPQRSALIDALYDAAWGGGGGVETAGKVAAVASRVGLDGPALIEAAGSPEAKDRVRQQTDRALEAGVFGVPTVIADGELFWGHDALPHVDLFLQGKDPLSLVDLRRWAELPASASRT